jgi:hypothetical protein
VKFLENFTEKLLNSCLLAAPKIFFTGNLFYEIFGMYSKQKNRLVLMMVGLRAGDKTQFAQTFPFMLSLAQSMVIIFNIVYYF